MCWYHTLRAQCVESSWKVRGGKTRQPIWLFGLFCLFVCLRLFVFFWRHIISIDPPACPACREMIPVEYVWICRIWMNMSEHESWMNKEWTWCIESPLLSVPNQSWSSYLAAKAQQDEEAASERSKRCEWLGKQLAKRKQEILGQTFTYFLHIFYIFLHVEPGLECFSPTAVFVGFQSLGLGGASRMQGASNLNGTLEHFI